MNELVFLLPAFTACLVLTGIHTYLGIHVIQREVIFLDIALAQIAALGITVGLVWGFEPDSTSAYVFALGFTCLGAVVFTFLRVKKVPQEAMIGVAFAVSSALAVLIADKIPHGGEHLKYILSGSILWVSWPLILKTAGIYAVMGAFHYVFRHRFLTISRSRAQAEQAGIKVWLWDLLFYLSFGLVITSSVQIGGILLVFSFLIVPALCSLLFFDELRRRILFGWIVGAFSSAVGIGVSYVWDWPTGPSIVATFGLVLVMSFIARQVIQGNS